MPSVGTGEGVRYACVLRLRLGAPRPDEDGQLARGAPREPHRPPAARCCCGGGAGGGAVAIPSTVAAQSDDVSGDVSDVVRIVGRRLWSGRIKFGLQQRTGPDAWGERTPQAHTR